MTTQSQQDARVREPFILHKFAAAALALALIFGGIVLDAPPASAGGAGNCEPWWSAKYPYVCVGVTTGAKNYSNGTQYVSKVVIRTALQPSFMEAWIGNGPTGVAWYRSKSGVTSATWYPNRWVKNGSGICGAYRHRSGGRSVTCITIRV